MTDQEVTPGKVALSGCATAGYLYAVYLDAKSSSAAHPKHSSYNAKAVHHQHSSPAVLKASSPTTSDEAWRCPNSVLANTRPHQIWWVTGRWDLLND